MSGLVEHLHQLVVEVQLTPEEWREAIALLTTTGHMTDEHRQEFILWSDALGVSMLVDALAHDLPHGATESTVLGPFFVPNSPLRSYGANIASQPAGDPAWVFGRVLTTDGEPIAGAELDVWQNGDNRLYAVQDPEAPDDHLRGRFQTRDDGTYGFIGVRPVSYSIPSDGTVGRMLSGTGRHAWRPAHIHLIVRARGFQTLTTHIFDSTSDYLDSDAVFAVKRSLVREFVLRSAEDLETPPGDRPRLVSGRERPGAGRRLGRGTDGSRPNGVTGPDLVFGRSRWGRFGMDGWQPIVPRRRQPATCT